MGDSLCGVYLGEQKCQLYKTFTISHLSGMGEVRLYRCQNLVQIRESIIYRKAVTHWSYIVHFGVHTYVHTYRIVFFLFFFFYLFGNVVQRVLLWPLYSWHRDKLYTGIFYPVSSRSHHRQRFNRPNSTRRACGVTAQLVSVLAQESWSIVLRYVDIVGTNTKIVVLSKYSFAELWYSVSENGSIDVCRKTGGAKRWGAVSTIQAAYCNASRSSRINRRSVESKIR